MARTPWPMRDGRMWSSAACDAFPAAQFAGMDGDAEAGLAGDLEGADIILEIAHALVAGDAEAGHQRMAASGREARRRLDRLDADMAHAGDDHAALDAGLGLGAQHAFAERVGIGLRRQAGLRSAWSGEVKTSE